MQTLREEGSRPCPKCGGPTAERPAAPYPVLSQALFALSFVVFLVLMDRMSGNRAFVWGWFVVQVALGVWLIRGRLRARRRILRCIRCNQALG